MAKLSPALSPSTALTLDDCSLWLPGAHFWLAWHCSASLLLPTCICSALPCWEGEARLAPCPPPPQEGKKTRKSSQSRHLERRQIYTCRLFILSVTMDGGCIRSKSFSRCGDTAVNKASLLGWSAHPWGRETKISRHAFRGSHITLPCWACLSLSPPISDSFPSRRPHSSLDKHFLSA